MSLGVFAEKIGMSRVFDENGNHIPVTVLVVKENKVLENKNVEKHGYSAAVVGFDEVKEKKLNKAQIGYLKKKESSLFRKLREFRVSEDKLPELGTELNIAEIFSEKQYVDVTSVSKGKGFAGVMKRHNFGGLRASHGVSITHRSHGSTGNMRREGRVLKGKKMAGHLGDKQVTIQNLQVVSLDTEKKLLIVKGSVPGAKGTLVKVVKAVKKGNQAASVA
ncbi:50S ribosomal protein L3 [Rickettsiales bacterium LUAb2]